MAPFFDRYLWVLGLLLRLRSLAATSLAGQCPGDFTLVGHGQVSLVSTGWNTSEGFRRVDVSSTQGLYTYIESRAYFGETCTEGPYDPQQYMKLNLLNKTIRYYSDLSGAGCGCNAAFYLTSMGHNPNKSKCHDHYCDANNVCGESCTEIDIQEGNIYAWHSTLHTAFDHFGEAAGYGGGVDGQWNGPRQWTPAEFGPGATCVDTNAAFEVAVSFPTNRSGFLTAMVVTLTQDGHDCSISIILDEYEGMAELTHALKAGMTPIVSYWASDDMIWLDGVGRDNLGTCGRDNASACPASVLWWGFSLEDLQDVDIAKAQSNVQEQSKRYPTKSTTTTDVTLWWERPTTTPWWASTANAWVKPESWTTTTTSPWWTPPPTEDLHFAQKFKESAHALFPDCATKWPLLCASSLLVATFALGVLAVTRAVRRNRTPAESRRPEPATNGGSMAKAASSATNSMAGLAAKPSSQALLDLEVSRAG